MPISLSSDVQMRWFQCQKVRYGSLVPYFKRWAQSEFGRKGYGVFRTTSQKLKRTAGARPWTQAAACGHRRPPVTAFRMQNAGFNSRRTGGRPWGQAAARRSLKPLFKLRFNSEFDSGNCFGPVFICSLGFLIVFSPLDISFICFMALIRFKEWSPL